MSGRVDTASVATAVVEVISTRGPAMIQDLGRRGHMHEGVPPGGALVPEWLALANRLVGNEPKCAAIEAFGEITLMARSVAIDLAVGARVHRLGAGERVTIPRDSSRRVTYIALAGGVDVPEVLGSRGTLLLARLGGLDGRVLRGGDLLRAVSTSGAATAQSILADLDLARPIGVIPGPDHDRFSADAVAALLGSTFTISPVSDRVGLRLRGTALTRVDLDNVVSTPMVRGAIQIPASGEPIVLGPDHPTTGGYPVIATVIRADFGALAGRAIGSDVRFREVTLDQAHEAWRTHHARFGLRR